MNDQGWETVIAARLRLLAAADQAEQASPRVENLVRSAYRRYYGASRTRWDWVVWGAVAASLLAFLALTAPWAPRTAVPAAKPGASPASPSRLEAPVRPAPLPAPRREPRARRYNVQAKPAPAPAARELTTDFIPLVYDDTLGADETHQVVRVRLSRSSLASFGVPIEEELPAGRVQADVLLGGDGTARAIRFVRYSQER